MLNVLIHKYIDGGEKIWVLPLSYKHNYFQLTIYLTFRYLDILSFDIVAFKQIKNLFQACSLATNQMTSQTNQARTIYWVELH